MAHLWNKISLVSAIALAGIGCFFAGCDKKWWDQNRQGIYDGLNDATTHKTGCSCSYYQYGQQYSVDFPEKIYVGCDGVQKGLTDQYGAAAKVNCWPN